MADVIIGGAGPAGLMLAAELRLAGVQPLVLERQPGLQDTPRANGLGGQILDLLRCRGLLDRFEAASSDPSPPPRFPFGGVRLDLTRLQDPPLHAMAIAQPQLERVLAERAAELGAEIRRGHEVTGIDDVTATVAGPDGPYQVSARYLVGCDGAHSRVRDWAGIDFPGTTYPEVNRLAEVTGPVPLRPGFTRTDRGVIASGSVRPGVLLIHTIEQEVPNGPDDQLPMTLTEFLASVRRVLGADLPITEATRLSRWQFSARLADRRETHPPGRLRSLGWHHGPAHGPRDLVRHPSGGSMITTSAFNLPAFNLPGRLAAKAAPALIATDEEHFAAIAASLAESIADLSARLEAELQAPGGIGQAAMDRDMQVHRLTARLRALRRFGLDLCLGRMVHADNPEPVYVGRLGLTDQAGRRLLVDWRSPAAEPFFGATHGNPMGLASRRRYRWTRGRISDYWDEVFTPDGLENQAALDDQSAFIASLGATRSPQMRDVLGTIAADQDAIIRAGSRGALVVDGGPGTGKTVVALHRSAYLLYSDPRLGHRRGGVLFVGPHQPYLAYVADVLPSLGEEGVQTCTLRDLIPEGAAAGPEADPEVARLKSSADLVRAIEPAVAFYEKPPAEALTVATPWGDVQLSPADWAEAFDAPEPGAPHNEARAQIWTELLSILMDSRPGNAPAGHFRRELVRNDELRTTFSRAWPIIDASDLVGDLWSVPAYLRLCAPWLTPDEIRRLQRSDSDAQAWTESDLPLLDAARHRLGDPGSSRRQLRHAATVAAERERMAQAVDNLIEVADDEYGTGLVTMLRGEDFTDALVDEAALPVADPDQLAGPFAHVVVDEAQELTDAQWQMLLVRCPSRSFTIVGDRAQARHGFTESWQQRLERVGFDQIRLASLTINYRTPEEVMAEAEPVIRAVLPDANVPVSIRSTGIPVRHAPVAELDPILDAWLATHDGIACVIGASVSKPRVQSLTPETAKGLEFDLVILVAPEAFGPGIEGAVDRYVSMTRATRQLVILS